MTYIKDLTERYPEGFGGICTDDCYDLELSLWEGFEDSFRKEQEEAMKRYQKEEKTRAKFRKAFQKLVKRVLESPDEVYNGQKQLFNGYHIAVYTRDGRHYIARGVNCRNSFREVVRISWNREYEIVEDEAFLESLYYAFGVNEEKWELDRSGTWVDVLEEV